MKPETEIKKLNKRINDLELLCRLAGVPLLAIQIPEIVITTPEPTQEDIDWTMKQIEKHELKKIRLSK